MRIVFMGTPEFACPSLSAVSKSHDVVRVVTRPDAVRGRGKRLEPSPVKALAGELGLAVFGCLWNDGIVGRHVEAQGGMQGPAGVAGVVRAEHVGADLPALVGAEQRELAPPRRETIEGRD